MFDFVISNYGVIFNPYLRDVDGLPRPWYTKKRSTHLSVGLWLGQTWLLHGEMLRGVGPYVLVPLERSMPINQVLDRTIELC